MTDFQFYVIMTWLAMIAGMLEKTKFRFAFFVILLVSALEAARALS